MDVLEFKRSHKIKLWVRRKVVE